MTRSRGCGILRHYGANSPNKVTLGDKGLGNLFRNLYRRRSVLSIFSRPSGRKRFRKWEWSADGNRYRPEVRPRQRGDMTYAATAVARAILEIARQAGRPLTPLELMKLTYISHGWSLCFRDCGLVNERAQAWQYGPVYPDLYHALKSYRASPVTQVPMSGTELFGASELTDDDKNLLKAVFEAYKGLNGVQLSALTHQPNTPWDKAWKRGKNTVIDDSEIKAHFCDLRDRRKAN